MSMYDRVASNRLTAAQRARRVGYALPLSSGVSLISKRMRNPVMATYSTRGWRNNNAELKYNDIAATVYACDSTGSVTALNLTAVGDDNTTRDGRQICNRSIHIRGLIRPQDDTTVHSLARVMLVWDSQPNSGTIAAVTDILVTANGSSFTNLNNRERFTILRDAQFPMGKVDTTATQAIACSPTVHDLSWFVNLKDIKTTYSGTTAAIGSVATGALLLLTIGSAAAGAGADAVLSTRLRFSDR